MATQLSIVKRVVQRLREDRLVTIVSDEYATTHCILPERHYGRSARHS